MITKLLTLSILLITFCEVTAQKIYKTERGHIEMMTLLNKKSISAESHKLALYLDYDSSGWNVCNNIPSAFGHYLYRLLVSPYHDRCFHWP